MTNSNTPSDEESVFKRFTGLPVYLFLVVAFTAMYLGALPSGMVGSLALLLPVAIVFEKLGHRIPILKDYLGGPPLLLIFIGAFLVFSGEILPFPLITEAAVSTFSGFMKGSGTAFLNFYICGLIVGAIFGIDGRLLVKAGLRYAIPLAACIICCCAMAAGIGSLVGFGWKDSIFNVAFPILGGGMGGGAIPMAQVIHDLTGRDMKEVISTFVPALALGNVFAIIAAGLLDKLGQKYPSLSGNGEILKDSDIKNIEPEVKINTSNIIIALVVSTTFLAGGQILNHFIPKVHYLAFMILLVAICKVFNLIPQYIVVACFSWFRLIMKVFTGIVLLAIGVVFTDLNAIIEAISVQYVLICAGVVFASVVGAGFAGRLVGFNFVESAITAGLCMANMGGTGDVAVLSAARRMKLMPFARFSTSIGGAMIIFLAGALASNFM